MMGKQIHNEWAAAYFSLARVSFQNRWEAGKSLTAVKLDRIELR